MLRFHVVYGVFQRNVKQYFNSVIGYLFIVVFVTACALLTFSQQFFADNLANLDQLSKFFPLLLLFIIPAISMGVWADERKQGTDALLFTLPVSDLEILIGKFLSVVGVYTVALGFSLSLVIPLNWLGQPDYGLIFTTYVGYWLAGVALLSVGMFASSLTQSGTIAFILGALLCGVPVLIGYYFQGNVWLESLGLPWHLHDFTIGLISLPGLIYFTTLTLFMLYLNLVVISRRHWHRGQQVSLGGHFLVRIVALIVALLAVNFTFIRSEALIPTRADFTAERIYTVDHASRVTLDKAAEAQRPITIQAFISPSVPREYVNLRNNLINILRQYDRIGGTNLEVRLVSVEPASVEATEAKSLGLESRNIQSFVGGKKIEQEVFMGAVITSSLGEVILPYIDNGASLEYELTRAIATSTDETKRITVGVLDTDLHFSSFRYSNPQTGLTDTYDWGFGQTFDHLKQHYAVKTVALDELGRWAESIRSGSAGQDSRTETDAEGETESSGEMAKQASATSSDEYPDVLIVAGPSFLDNASMLDLITYIENGQATLILADPMPVSFLSKSADFYGIINAASQPRIQTTANWGVTTVTPEPKSNLGLSVKQTNYADCIINFAAKFTSPKNQQFEAIFRFVDHNNYWRLQMTDEGSFRLIKRQGGTDTTVDSKTIPFFDTSIPVDVEIELTGDKIDWRSGMLNGTIHDSFNRDAGAHGIHLVSDAVTLSSFSISIVETAATEFEDAKKKVIYDGRFHGTCALLCQKLGIEWDYDRVVWQRYNPHYGFIPAVADYMADTWPPNYGPKENMFLFATSYANHIAFDLDDEISQGLKEVLFMYPGAIRKRAGSNDLFRPLISLKPGDSGTADWEDVTTTIEAEFVNRLTGEREIRPLDSIVTGNPIVTLEPDPPVFPGSDEPPVLAARISGERLNVVFIADTDFVGDFYYKQLEPVGHLMDNITFLQNTIESLAGDVTFVRLRNRRPSPRTLTRFEQYTERYRRERAEQEQLVEKNIKEQLDRTEKELNQLQETIAGDQDLSLTQKAQSVEMGASSALVKMKNRKRKLETEREESIEQLRAKERIAISNQESLTRALSVGFAPMLPLILGLVVFFYRVSKERSQVTPERRATHR